MLLPTYLVAPAAAATPAAAAAPAEEKVMSAAEAEAFKGDWKKLHSVCRWGKVHLIRISTSSTIC